MPRPGHNALLKLHSPLDLFTTRLALCGGVLLSFLVRAGSLDFQSLWRDEVDVIRFAAQPLPELLRNFTLAEHNGPLYYILMRGWLHLAGTSELALRFIALVCGVLSIPLLWCVARPLVGQRAALLATLLAAISPYLAWYAQDAKMYATFTMLILLALWCAGRALQNGQVVWWGGFVFAASLSLYIHLMAVLMIPLYALMLLVWPSAPRGRRHGLVALGFLTLPYLPLALWQLPLLLQPHPTGHAFVPLSDMFALLFALHTRGVALVGDWPVSTAFLFAVLVGIFAPAMRMDARVRGSAISPEGTSPWRARLFLALWAFLPVVLLFGVTLRLPLFQPRYLIFTLPPFLMLTARGIMALACLTRPVALALLAVVLAFSALGLWVQGTQPLKSDFRAAAAFVAQRYQAGEPIMFQVPYARYTFDYYFPQAHPTLEGPWTNDGKSAESVVQLLRETTQGYATLWLVVSESWLWDERDLTRAWLREHAELLGKGSFARVEVYHYQLH
jgi:uncharacterized membrane protein